MRLANIVIQEDGLRLFRRSAAGNFDLAVRVTAADRNDSVRATLSAAQSSATIDGLPRGAEVVVEVRPRFLVRRLRHRSEAARFRLQPQPFRILVIGSGRCGTTTLARWFDGMRFRDGTPVKAGHESLSDVVLPLISNDDHAELTRVIRGQAHNVEAGAFYALAADSLVADRIVHLVRDGRRVVQSGLNRGWYQNDGAWNRVKPDFAGDVFEKCCRLWVHTCRESDRVAQRTVRLEDLATDAAARAGLLADLGLVGDADAFPHANRGRAPSRFVNWSADHRKRFEAICAATMDRHYPDWRSSW